MDTPSWAVDTSRPFLPSEVRQTSCCSSSKVMKVAAAIFLLSAICITTAALCMHYPMAANIIYITFGIASGVALITSIGVLAHR